MGTVLTAQQHAETMTQYVAEGIERARALGNRGPLKLDSNGKLTPDILDAYDRTGFYIFEGAIKQAEIDLLRADMEWLLDRAPVDNGAKVDHQGRPAYGLEFARPVYSMIQPLADPWGGTKALNGRHPTQMAQPVAADQPPHKVVFIMTGMCQTMPSGLRLYGHPDLLSVAASINGDDFVPYNDAIFIKQPGRGGSVSWHQDGVTHWDNSRWDSSIHGFNFQVQLFDTSARSCLWVVPGTHKEGKIDIKAMVEEAGSERLTDAVPLVCEAGDVVICNRQLVHGSFANAGFEPRLTINFGFHRRSSVLNVKGAGIHSPAQVYTDEIIRKRSRVIGYAIDARQQKYPDEQPFEYKPFAQRNETFRWNDSARAELKDYNLLDLSI